MNSYRCPVCGGDLHQGWARFLTGWTGTFVYGLHILSEIGALACLLYLAVRGFTVCGIAVCLSDMVLYVVTIIGTVRQPAWWCDRCNTIFPRREL